MSTRYEHIDKARGIAILLVVLGHCHLSATQPLNRLILSFHMPLFFFLSGLFARQSDWGSVLVRSKDKAQKLLVPQLSLAVTVAVMLLVTSLLKRASLLGRDYFIGLCYWFLPTLFLSELLYMLLTCVIDLKKLLCKIIVLLGTVALIVTALYGVDIPNGCFTQYLKLVPVAFLFYLVGSFSRNFVLNCDSRNVRCIDIALLFGIPILCPVL